MNWSKFNYTFKSQEGYFLYNSLSTAIVQMEQGDFQKIQEHIASNTFPTDNYKLMEILMKIKAVVPDNNTEFLKLKYISTAKRFSNSILMLTINPTLDCNFDCSYCFEGEHRHLYMNEQVEDQIISFINSHKKANAIHVTWFGGEPLLAMHRIESLTTKILSLGKSYRAGIITNGYLLDDRVARKLKDLYIDSVQVTLDGLAETHDKRRCLKTGKPTFEKIVANVKRLVTVAPDINISIRVNIDKNNEDEFIQVYNLFEKMNNKHINVSPAFVEDLSKDKPMGCICNSAEQNKFLVELFNKYGLEYPFFYSKSRRVECAIRNPNALVIGPEGELYKCWNDVGNQIKHMDM